MRCKVKRTQRSFDVDHLAQFAIRDGGATSAGEPYDAPGNQQRHDHK